MPSVQWAHAAPLWTLQQVGFDEPTLVKLEGDNFLPDFLAAMAGQTPATWLNSSARQFDAPEDRVGPDSDTKLKLYHPAHGRYYLVLGSLVCRQMGLPDRTVAQQDGERTSFVIRRLAPIAGQSAAQEQGWVEEGPNRGWQPLVDERGRAVRVRADEERLPMHPVTVCTQAEPDSSAAGPLALFPCDERTVYYGYVPVGNREKYLERYKPPAGATPGAALNQFTQAVRAESTQEASYDYRLDEFNSRVREPWERFFVNPARPAPTPPAPWPSGSPENWDNIPVEQQNTLSLYLLLDLADFINRYLPDVFKAIAENSSTELSGNRLALYDELNDIYINSENPVGVLSLAAAIRERQNDIELVRGQGEEPSKLYDLHDAPTSPPTGAITVNAAYLASGGPFETLVRTALGSPSATMSAPEEIASLLQSQVTIDREGDPDFPLAGTYFIRLVYEYPPCAPVVSELSPAFVFAKFFDPDAPARPIHIELPSIKMQDLRKYKRGVGLEMSPELRDVMNRVHKGLLEDEDLAGSPGGWELGMICSFSLQIIFLVAFIVMFIFLIVLNFIFWWLAFLKICFPIPVKK